jgi:hypothetical protein
MKQIEVINLETIIDVTAETSNVEILVKDYDSELAERFALEAQEAAIDAEESADIATAQASIATAQAGIATTQAGIATTQAGNALTSANNAAASAQEAQDIVDSIITADLTEATSSVLTITGGTDAVLGTGTTIQVKQAGSSQSGFLSSTDWTTFNSKQDTITNPITGTLATGQVAFGTASNTIGGNSGFLFDSSLRQLRIFSSIQQLLYNATSGILQLNGSALDTAPTIKINQLTGNDTSYGNLEFLGTRSSLTIVAKIRSNRRGVLDFCTQDAPNAGDPPVRWSITNTGILQSNEAQTIQTSSGALTLQSGNRNVLINTTTDAGFRLDVNGTARVQGNLTTNLTAGSVPFIGASGLLSQDNTNLFWDNTNKRLGVGTNAPTNHLHINAPVGFDGFDAIPMLFVRNTAVTNAPASSMIGLAKSTGDMADGFGAKFMFSIADNTFGDKTNQIAAICGVRSGADNSGALIFQTATTGSITTKIQVFPTGNTTIQNGGTFTDNGFRLDVNGTARVQGVLTTTADAVVNGVNIGRGGGAVTTNTRVGTNAGANNTTGTNNSFFGTSAGQSNTTGGSNSFFGVNAGFSNTTGVSNSFFGNTSGANNTTGGNNVFLGFDAGRRISAGTSLTISNNSIFIGKDSRANADNQTNQIVIGHEITGLGTNTTVIGNSSTTFGRWFGNLLVGSSTNSGQMLQVTGTSLLNGLSTIQGTTASDSGQLGAELLTTGTSDASWTGTSFATGYTHVAGSTTTLTSTLAGVVGTFYQITYTVTGRTTGTFNIDFGGQTLGGLGSSSAQGVRATTTGTLVITPTSSFDGTIVLSIRVITASSASVTFNNSSGTVTNQIRISNSVSNTFFGLNAGSRNTTGINNTFIGSSTGSNNTSGNSNSFFGISAGRDNTFGSSNSFFGSSSGLLNTTGIFNSFFGQGSGQSNTTGNDNSFFGRASGITNTTGNSNSFFGASSGNSNTSGTANSFFGQASGFSNTTGGSNSFFGQNAGFNISSGSQNTLIGLNAGRFTGTGTTAMTSIDNSIYLGYQTRGLNATGSTNEIVIGINVVGLGSNTIVLGNTSTTHGRWYGSLLLGTTTNAASSILTMESTTQGFLPPRMTTTQKNAIASPATGLVVYDTTLNKLCVRGALTWETVTSL